MGTVRVGVFRGKGRRGCPDRSGSPASHSASQHRPLAPDRGIQCVPSCAQWARAYFKVRMGYTCWCFSGSLSKSSEWIGVGVLRILRIDPLAHHAFHEDAKPGDLSLQFGTYSHLQVTCHAGHTEKTATSERWGWPFSIGRS